jgi:hypothetical protein
MSVVAERYPEYGNGLGVEQGGKFPEIHFLHAAPFN